MKIKQKVERLNTVKFASLIALILAIFFVLVSIVLTEPLVSSALLILGIILFVVWFLIFFSSSDKLQKLVKKK